MYIIIMLRAGTCRQEKHDMKFNIHMYFILDLLYMNLVPRLLDSYDFAIGINVMNERQILSAAVKFTFYYFI